MNSFCRYAGCVAWTMVYDTVYAHQVSPTAAAAAAVTHKISRCNQDAADDSKLRLNSTAVAWGSSSKT